MSNFPNPSKDAVILSCKMETILTPTSQDSVFEQDNACKVLGPVSDTERLHHKQ